MLFSDVECQTSFADGCSNNSHYNDVSTEDVHSTGITLEASRCSEMITQDDKTLTDDDINVDFPSLTAAASFHEKKHDSCSASLARKFKQARSHMSDSVDSQHSLPEDQSHSEVAHYSSATVESIPASNAFVQHRHAELPANSGVWRELQRKSSGSENDVAIPLRPKVLTDREQERPIIGSSSSVSGKTLTSVAMVLGDFLKPNQKSDSAESKKQSPEFVPLFVCTLCGERTHSCRDCSQSLEATFRD